MTEDTLSNDTIINDILYNDTSIALEKLTILLDKSSSNDVSKKDSEKLSYNTTVMMKPIIILVIKTIRESKRPGIGVIYLHISNSEGTNVDCDFIALVLNDLENENENIIFNEPTIQVLDSYFIATHRG